MQSNEPFLPDQVGSGYNYDDYAKSVFDTVAPPPRHYHAPPSQNTKLQLSEACPKNFIIFDQTDFRSQIVFHPEMASSFYPHLNINASSFFQGGMEKINTNHEDNQEIPSSSQREDSDDIDALLMSFEEEDSVESEDEEVSTARTDANYGSSSPDSCSNYQSQSGKSRLPYHKKSSVNGERCSTRKHKKLRKMVKTLRGIVPGANGMNTVAVLDETVRYLKSLKVEVQKLGIKNLQS